MALKSATWPLLLMCGITFAIQPGARSQTIIGLQPGVKAPEIALADQTGKTQSLNSLTGPNGLLLLFFRSADWCPFCKGQLVDLEHAQKLFAAKGIHVAASVTTLPRYWPNFRSGNRSHTRFFPTHRRSLSTRSAFAMSRPPERRPASRSRATTSSTSKGSSKSDSLKTATSTG